MADPGGRRAGDELIDRDPQNLPMRLGGFRVVRRIRRTSQSTKWWRANSPNLVALTGLVLAAWGAYLATASPVTSAYLSGTTYVIGGVTLPETATKGVFSSSAGTLVLVHHADESFDAAAATSSNGRDVAGHCHFEPPRGSGAAARLAETCEFWVGVPISGPPSFTSNDTLDLTVGSVWHRVYSDGHSVDIAVPGNGAAAPVPLPVGR